MRVRPSRKENLARGGVTIRVYRDTREKAHELCSRRSIVKFADCIDQLVDEALQLEYDRADQENRGNLGISDAP